MNWIFGKHVASASLYIARMKALFLVSLLLLSLLSFACQSETTSLPEHAQEVREKHKLKDSLRSLEIIEALKQGSSNADSLIPPQD